MTDKLSLEAKNAICPASIRCSDGGAGMFDYTRKNINNGSVSYWCTHNRGAKCTAKFTVARNKKTGVVDLILRCGMPSGNTSRGHGCHLLIVGISVRKMARTRRL